MKKFTLFFFTLPFLTLSFNLFAQITIKGSVFDAETNEALQYCNISIKGKNAGCITNEDGNFSLRIHDLNETIVISYLSYKTKELPATYFQKNKKVFLQHYSYLLAETEIYASNDYLYKMISDCSKKNRKAPDKFSKAYFSLETTAGKDPVEVIECYYNSKITKNNPEGLLLKNGRIALAGLNGFYFVSLSTGDILTSYNIFENPDRYLNLNPLQMNNKAMKRKYSLNVISVSGDKRNIYQIGFKPVNPESELFEGEIWIDRSNNNILRLTVTDNNMAAHPFLPLSPEHKLDSVSFSINYNFTADSIESMPEFIQFGYSFNYDDSFSVKRIQTKGILYFFENEMLFDNPKFSHNDYYSKSADMQNIKYIINDEESKFIYSRNIGTYTDYDKIVSMPYNDFFWKHNDAILLSDKKKSYLNFFKENGVLLNYDELSALSGELFSEKKLKWSAGNRITSEMLNNKNNFAVNSGKNLNYSATRSLGDFYNLAGQIFMDINKFGDTVSVLTATLIDLDESFYYLQKEAYTDCFINNYFDLIEMQRRSMVEDINKNNYSVSQIDSVYMVHISRLNETQARYIKECARGSNTEELDKWTGIIEKSLGINNNLLLNDSVCGMRLRTEFPGENIPAATEKYNAASVLYNIGQYQGAKDLFLEAVSDGDKHPWLFYNLALTCYKLGETENACKYLKLSEDAGEKPDSALLRRFCE